MRENFLHWIYPFLAFLSNFGFCCRKAFPHPHVGKYFYTESIHFRQFRVTLVLVAEKPPSPQDEGFFYTGSIHFRQFRATLVFVAEKPPPLPPRWGKFFVLDLSISGNFEQLWFLWQKSPPPPRWGNFFYTGSIHFRQFWATLIFVAEKPSLQDEGNFLHWIYPFQAILSNFGFCGRKAPPPLKMREHFSTLDLSISGNYEQLWFLWQKGPPLKMWENFLHWIYPFQVISSNFGSCGRKAAPSPLGEGHSLYWIYPFQAISSNFGFCGRKAPLPQDEGIFFTPDLSISGNVEQLWFLWQKSPPSPKMRDFFYTGSIHFRQFWATLVFVAGKPPPMREIFYTGSIHFRQFWAPLVIVAEKPPSKMREFFLHWIYPFQAISSNIGLCGRPPPPRWGNFFRLDLSISGNVPVTLVFVGEKPSLPPRWGKLL